MKERQKEMERNQKCAPDADGRVTGEVVFGRRRDGQPIEFGVPVALRGVDPVAHGQALQRLGHGWRGGQGVRVLLRPRERARARVGCVAAVT